MPNHICNIVKVKGDSEEVKNFMESVAKEKAQYENEATGYGTIDFNKVIPEPEYKNNTDWYDCGMIGVFKTGELSGMLMNM